MKWTTEKPTEPGWYWMLYNDNNKPECVRVSMSTKALAYISSLGFKAYLNDARLSCAKWAGPILEPEE